MNCAKHPDAMAIGILLGLACSFGCTNHFPSNSNIKEITDKFTVYISNQSFEIKRVDIEVRIDGKLIAYDNFYVGDQHRYIPFGCQLAKGSHHICIRSKQLNVSLTEEFDSSKHAIGVVEFSGNTFCFKAIDKMTID